MLPALTTLRRFKSPSSEEPKAPEEMREDMLNISTAGYDEGRVTELVRLAIRGLGPMYDPEQGLFCDRLTQNSTHLIREGISRRYTIMTLLGLLQAEASGFEPRVSIPHTLDSLLRDTWVDNVGDLGLLLWVCAVSSQEYLDRFFERYSLLRALERYSDALRRHTMELSWLLTGLSYTYEVKKDASLADLAHKAYALLRCNQGEQGLFGHLSQRKSLAGIVRGHIGSFADQVYPIIAMTKFSQEFSVREARNRAMQCASAICRLQGPLGQWWWHYDSRTGRVVEQYPVYSVHQHGMGPMALFTLLDDGESNLFEPIRRGLNWIGGHNELQIATQDTSRGIIWRSMYIPKPAIYWARLRGLAGVSLHEQKLSILHECRPYELGWLLFALAPRIRNFETCVDAVTHSTSRASVQVV